MVKNLEVDKYISETPLEFRLLLSDLRNKLFDLFPEGEETFAYNIPVYKYKGKAIFSIAAFKNHYSIITQDKDIASKIPELANYNISGTTVHFTLAKPMTDDLLKKIIARRISDRDQTIS